MSVRVVSKRAGGTKPVAGETVVNIARPSMLGNPFYMACEHDRNKVVAQYRAWLIRHSKDKTAVWDEVLKLAARSKAGESLALECWCAPCACHGDVIIEAINEINGDK